MSRFFERIFSVSRSLLGSPMFFGLLYLALIPAFALAFFNQRDGFTHSNIAREASTERLIDGVEADLRRALTAAFDNGILLNGLAPLYAQAGTIPTIIADQEWDIAVTLASVTLSGSYFYAGDLADLSGRVIEPADGYWNTFEPLNDYPSALIELTLLDLGVPTDFGTVFDGSGLSFEIPFSVVELNVTDPEGKITAEMLAAGLDSSTTDSTKNRIQLPEETVEALRQILAAQSGDDSQAIGGYARMLYLSAVTITTLGYGDIVPTKATTRFLVAFESVLGIVVMGLFLNASVNRRPSTPAKQPTTPPPLRSRRP